MLTISTTDMNAGLTPQDLAQELVGTGITISNVKYTGDKSAGGKYSGGLSDGLSIESGVMLSSGSIADAKGPNESESTTADFGLPGDSDLDTLIPGFATEDASVLEFDFVATGGSLSFQYVFGSEEYNEFVGSPFNDVFGFFLDGKNIALIPGTSTPVSINNVNAGDNASFFRNNSPEDLGVPTPFGTQADGFTVPLQAVATVTPGTHHIKLAIADAGDGLLDSWVFLSGQSFVSGHSDVQITKSDAPDPVAIGNPLTYSLVVTNNGPDPATGVIVQDPLPAGVTFASASTSQGSVFQAGGVVTAVLGQLAVGASATVTFVATPTKLGTITNTATVQAAQVDDDQSNNTATVSTDVVRFNVKGVTQPEGSGGLTDFVFTVSQPAGATDTATIAFATADGSALAGSDYIASSGVLTFSPGQTQKFVTIKVVGDFQVEPNEAFFLVLHDVGNPAGNRIEGAGIIINDDTGFSIGDASVVEGNSGTRNAVFTVTVSGVPQTVPISVQFGTNDSTAHAGIDYVPTSGVLTFVPGVTSRTVTVQVIGDALSEENEFFYVQLLNPVNAGVEHSPGLGTIIDDDLVSALYINDVHVTALESGPADAVFTVALDRASGQGLSVQYATSDGTAVAGTNYQATSGTLSFAPGVTSQLVTVPVMTNGVYTPNEQFFLNLFNPVHAAVVSPRGVGTIIYSTPPGTEEIVDDGDSAYDQSSGWIRYGNTLSYGLDFNMRPAGNGSGFADWTYSGLAPGSYQVFTKWIPASNRATNAPYTIYDGSTPLATVRVNQQVMPAGDQSEGVVWQSLGTFSTSTGMLRVRLSDNANGNVVADAVRIVSGGIGPQIAEMDVSGVGRSIVDSAVAGAASPDESNGTDFGVVPAFTNSIIDAFTITNTGNADLHLTGAPRVSLSGANASDFTVLNQPPATIAPGTSATFQIMFHPSVVGLRTAVVSIPDDDSAKAPYTFDIQGTGIDAGATQLVVDDAGSGYQQQGAWTAHPNSTSSQGQFRSDPGGQGSDWTTWNFANLAPGNYSVYTTYVAAANRATNAPFTLTDGSSQRTVLVNEQVAPADLSYNGLMWKSLGSLALTSGHLTVSLSNQANGLVVADAVYLVRNDVPSAGATGGAATTNSNSSLANTSTTTGSGNAVHNPVQPLDVNGDGAVSALDALLLIENLGSAALAPTGNFLMDVNDDGAVSPVDLLMVIASLRTAGPQTAVAAPQAAPASAAAATADNLAAGSVAAPNAQVAAALSPGTVSAAAVDQALSQLIAAPSAAAVSPTSKALAAAVTSPIKKSSAPSKSGCLLDAQDN